MKALRAAVTAAVAILTPVVAFAALTLLPSAPASAAPADNGVNLAPLCSALSGDTFIKLRDSHVLPAAAVKAANGLPPALVAEAVRVKLGCDSTTLVTGAKVNAVLCDQILNRDYIVGVIDSPKLPLKPAQRTVAAAQVSDKNVAQARDLFNCDVATPPASPPASSSSSPPPATSQPSTSQPSVTNPSPASQPPVKSPGTPTSNTGSSSSATSSSHTSNTQKPSTDGDSLTKLPNTSAGIDTGGL